jgi:putative membrane protein insertion efficiency factor
MNIAQKGLVFIIRVYQLTLSPLRMAVFGPLGRCRFTPSCSQYAREAIYLHGAMRGGFLAARRLCRCHPWGDFGQDLPPPAESFKGHCHGS